MTDFFTELRGFAARLGSAELSVWGERLIDAIEAGSTGTEIQMAIRWNLEQLLRENKVLPRPLRQTAELFIREINNALGIACSSGSH